MTSLLAFVLLSGWLAVGAGAQRCSDAAGRVFVGNTTYYLDQRTNCTIMLCRHGVPTVLRRRCPESAETTRRVTSRMSQSGTCCNDRCRPALECPEQLELTTTFCALASGERGLVCPATDSGTAAFPQRIHASLSPVELTAVLNSPLPETAQLFLLSLPPVTADGQSAVEQTLQAAMRNATDDDLNKLMQAASEFVHNMMNATRDAQPVSSGPSSTRVFNLNFRTSPEAHQLGLEAIRELTFLSMLMNSTARNATGRSNCSTTTSSVRSDTQWATSSPTSSTQTTTPETPIVETKPVASTLQLISEQRSSALQRLRVGLGDGPAFGRNQRTTPLPTAGGRQWLNPFTRSRHPRAIASGGADQPGCTCNRPPVGERGSVRCRCQGDQLVRPASTASENTSDASDGPAASGSSRQPYGARVKRQLSSGPFQPTDREEQDQEICDPSAIYRTADGKCNNLEHPDWGSRLTPLRRLFPNTYSDGIFAPTSSPTLPNARLASERTMDSESAADTTRTLSVMSWGQFVDHDLSHTPIFQIDGEEGIECCQPDSTLPPPVPPVHPQCMPLAIREGDSFYGPHRQRCMSFVRSIPSLRGDCSPCPANQLNDITHWIDGSQIYGSTLEQQLSLRTLVGGKMRLSEGNLLPTEVPQTSENDTLATSCRKLICFVAGDSRVNENPVLTTIHTILVREHNRVAQALKLSNSYALATDEELFQRARRIVIAEVQHLTYNEWLPALLGYTYAKTAGLLTDYDGHSNAYVATLKPNIANVFATAGFRLHTLVQGLIKFITASGQVSSSLLLRDTFFEPSCLLFSSLFTQLARGISVQAPQSFDRHFTSELRGQLFSMGCFGLDLIAMNIQRGRDHGIAKYKTVLQWCTNIAVTNWHDLLHVMPQESVSRLQDTYSSPEEVDLYVGLNMERPAAGTMLGPTARCIITEQFLRLRYADRFFYDLGGQPGSFTADELQQLKRTSWARILCDNVGGDFSEVQKYAFFRRNPDFNPVKSCHLLPSVNLDVF